MIDLYVRLNGILRHMMKTALDGRNAWEAGESYAQGVFADYIEADLSELQRLWPKDAPLLPAEDIRADLRRKHGPRFESVTDGVVQAGEILDDYFARVAQTFGPTGFVDLLEPTIIASSLQQFRDGHYREAVLNSVMAVYELIRERTREAGDGIVLAGKVFTPDAPILAVANLATRSGKDEQRGFMQLVQGAYMAIRNPKAHSLHSDLTVVTAGQHLVFASLLARRVRLAKRRRQRRAPSQT
jgi:uncharacterized protein (TIGR02391 family)